MKEELIFKHRGFSTLEIIIAVAIVLIALAVAASALFSVDLSTLGGELSLASVSTLEKYFIEISQSSNDTVSVGTDITQCIQRVHIEDVGLIRGIPRAVSAEFLVVDTHFPEQIKESCYAPEPHAQDWAEYSVQSFLLSDVVHQETITDIDVVSGIAYISLTSDSPTSTDLIVFDTEQGSVISSTDIGKGIVALDAIQGYVFTANESSTTQLSVIRTDTLEHPTVVAERGLQGVDPYGSFPYGRSVTYVDGIVYVGTRETAGPEFHMFDVHNLESPYEVSFLELSHNVHDISAKNGFAYLATSADTKEIIILDVHDPWTIHEVGSFNAGTSASADRDAMSEYLIGTTLYAGRRRGNAQTRELYAIDMASSTAPLERFSVRVPLSGTTHISGLIAQGNVLFVSSTDPAYGFSVYDMSDVGNVRRLETTVFAEAIDALDSENGVVYGVSNSKKSIYVFKPSRVYAH